MARVATYLLSSLVTPMLDTGVYNIRRDIALPNAGASNGDYIPVFTVQRAARSVRAKLSVSATLGAGCTLQLAQYRAGALIAALTAASTAAAASVVTDAALANGDFLAGDEIVLVVAGANIGAAATASVDVNLQH